MARSPRWCRRLTASPPDRLSAQPVVPDSRASSCKIRVMTASWFLVALRHDRAVVLGSLAFVVLLAWSYLLLGAGVGPEMMDMGAGQMMAMPPEWSLGLRSHHLRHVGGDDAGDDAAERRTRDAADCQP